MTIENSTFTGNVAVGSNFSSGGGAIAVDRGQASLTHVTIASNRAEDGARGGGIHGPFFDLELRSTRSRSCRSGDELDRGSEHVRGRGRQ